ncbi:flavodoxin [Lapidilactobacillus luobeiensis]|uniref:flavodoxin n=1 Tax=Lapidilactobacillus luobeiensis TaxID=2950371 RepID=UPI0021C47E48|nr:flavodoxin [Lapidilactobacillus luobeiensis]
MKRKWILFLGALVVLIGLFTLDISKSRPRPAATPVMTATSASQAVTRHENSATDRDSSSQKAASQQSTHNSGRVLIIYYSRSGTNYPDVTLKHGHTWQIAREIAQVTGGTRYQIQTAQAYPKNYQATVDQAEQEQQDNARPRLKGKLPDVTQYETIFLGYPIWWSDLPMPVRTLMDQIDLNDKVVIPFSTNAGSGWGDSLATLKKQYPQAKFQKGFEIEGAEVDQAHKQIRRWLRDLGY